MRDPEYCDERRLERRLADVLVVPGIKKIKLETWARRSNFITSIDTIIILSYS
jgi:hypothetical protein